MPNGEGKGITVHAGSQAMIHNADREDEYCIITVTRPDGSKFTVRASVDEYNQPKAEANDIANSQAG